MLASVATVMVSRHSPNLWKQVKEVERELYASPCLFDEKLLSVVITKCYTGLCLKIIKKEGMMCAADNG